MKNGTRICGHGYGGFQKHEYAQIDTNASTMDLCWVGIGETKNSMKIETRIKVWVERNKKHGYADTDMGGKNTNMHRLTRMLVRWICVGWGLGKLRIA